MKIFCEYCGSRIDTEADRKCPNCGASYDKNETFIKYENQKKEKLDKINEFSNQVFNQVTNSFKFSKIIFMIVFSLAILIILFVFIRMFILY